MKRDYYDILGVSKTATDAELKSAFRKAAVKHHPDKNPGDNSAEEKFKEVNEAYEVLKDPQKRAAYDRFGHAASDGSRAGSGFGGGGSGANGFDFNFGQGGSGFGDMFSDIFSDFFGGGRGGQQKDNRGGDLRYDLRITLAEAFAGLEKSLVFRRAGTCKTCNVEGGRGRETCGKCKGSGVISIRQGFFISQTECDVCHGLGVTFRESCRTCRGSGISEEEAKLKIKIPAGVDTGARLRIEGEGEAGILGSPSGDLYVYIQVAPDKRWMREGKNLHATGASISFVTAALGGSLDIPVIEGGEINVKIPAGLESGERLRIPGRGMPSVGSSARGDMFIEIKVVTPKKLSKRQEDLLREFDAETAPKKKRGFFK